MTGGGYGVKRLEVTSSNVKSVGYDRDQQLLEVEFKGGGIYRYSGVPLKVYQALVGAASIGSYLATAVKGKFPFTKAG